MKYNKSVLIGCVVSIVSVAIGYSSIFDNQEAMCPYLLENIEALSQGEDGTRVGDCYERAESAFNAEQKYAIACDLRTTEDMIYPCPQLMRYDIYGKVTKCTK